MHRMISMFSCTCLNLNELINICNLHDQNSSMNHAILIIQTIPDTRYLVMIYAKIKRRIYSRGTFIYDVCSIFKRQISLYNFALNGNEHLFNVCVIMKNLLRRKNNDLMPYQIDYSSQSLCHLLRSDWNSLEVFQYA